MKNLNLKENEKKIIVGVGLATFVFGFAAAALLNLILLYTKNPLVLNYRSSLSYVSSIFGDGLVLPVVNMMIVYFLIKHKNLLSGLRFLAAFISGFLITLYFYMEQYVNHIVNWSMTKPGEWNILGVWHALYMFSVVTLLSFYFLSVASLLKEKKERKHFIIILLLVIFFLVLLKLDYAYISFKSLI